MRWPATGLRECVSIMVFEAGYPHASGSSWRKVVKCSIMVKKKQGMSDDDFIQYYNHHHAQRAAPILQRHGILSYSLVIPFFVCAHWLRARRVDTQLTVVPS